MAGPFLVANAVEERRQRWKAAREEELMAEGAAGAGAGAAAAGGVVLGGWVDPHGIHGWAVPVGLPGVAAAAGAAAAAAGAATAAGVAAVPAAGLASAAAVAAAAPSAQDLAAEESADCRCGPAGRCVKLVDLPKFVSVCRRRLEAWSDGQPVAACDHAMVGRCRLTLSNPR